MQNNPFALPYLSPGRNTVTVSVKDPASLGANKLVVTYAYRTGARRKSYEQLCLEGKELSRGHDASWDTVPTVVQKTFAAGDLPARFTIDVPTPQGFYPVYPRMLLVRREVLEPHQQPLPLPAASDSLMTLQDPLLTGVAAPPQRPERPVRTSTRPLQGLHFVEKSGALSTSDALKWPKTNGEAVPSLVYLIGGDLPEMPSWKDLAGARLVIPLTRAHPRAPTKLGAVALGAAPEPDRPYDFKNLGDVLGATIVPLLADDAPSWAPPREFKLDITRYLRSRLLDGTKHHGFGLRVLPDRSVDDGWTVRVQLPSDPAIRLEIDTYLAEGQNDSRGQP